jgi:hypothetical protein
MLARKFGSLTKRDARLLHRRFARDERRHRHMANTSPVAPSAVSHGALTHSEESAV